MNGNWICFLFKGEWVAVCLCNGLTTTLTSMVEGLNQVNILNTLLITVAATACLSPPSIITTPQPNQTQ